MRPEYPRAICRAGAGHSATRAPKGHMTDVPHHDCPTYYDALSMAYAAKSGWLMCSNSRTRVRAAGLDSLIEPWLTCERGRPATLTGTALLVGMFLAADQYGGKVQLVQVTDMLYFKISPRMRKRLGVAAKPDTDDGIGGASRVDGAWCCPQMPEPLLEATTDLKHERIDPQTWQQRVKARAPHRLVPKQAPHQDGQQRFLCPAAAGKLHRPLKPPLPPNHPKRHLLPIPRWRGVGEDPLQAQKQRRRNQSKESTASPRTRPTKPSKPAPPAASAASLRPRSRLDPPRLPSPPRQHLQARHLGRHTRRGERRATSTASYSKTQEQTTGRLDTRRTPRPWTPGGLTSSATRDFYSETVTGPLRHASNRLRRAQSAPMPAADTKKPGEAINITSAGPFRHSCPRLPSVHLSARGGS